jgi:hypothetical protein
MHKKNIEHIIKSGTDPQMGVMKEILIKAVTKLKETDPNEYNNIEFCLHKAAHGHKVGEELAHCWVEEMKNKDGTTGAHWTWEQVSQVFKERKIGDDIGTLYVVLNMMYSDYYNSKFDTSVYIDMAKDWINDPDADEYKTIKYYYYIVHK